MAWIPRHCRGSGLRMRDNQSYRNLMCPLLAAPRCPSTFAYRKYQTVPPTLGACPSRVGPCASTTCYRRQQCDGHPARRRGGPRVCVHASPGGNDVGAGSTGPERVALLVNIPSWIRSYRFQARTLCIYDAQLGVLMDANSSRADTASILVGGRSHHRPTRWPNCRSSSWVAYHFALFAAPD